MKEIWQWTAKIKITVRLHTKSYTMQEFNELIKFGRLDKEQIIDIEEFDNLITNVGKNHIRNMLSGAITDGDIKALGWGTSATAPLVTQTLLGAESARKQVTSQRTTPTIGQLITTVYIAPGEGNINIRELGWFAGANASFTAINTGSMISRVLYTRNKVILESICTMYDSWIAPAFLIAVYDMCIVVCYHVSPLVILSRIASYCSHSPNRASIMISATSSGVYLRELPSPKWRNRLCPCSVVYTCAGLHQHIMLFGSLSGRWSLFIRLICHPSMEREM